MWVGLDELRLMAESKGRREGFSIFGKERETSKIDRFMKVILSLKYCGLWSHIGRINRRVLWDEDVFADDDWQKKKQ